MKNPELGEVLPSAHPGDTAIALLGLRRSTLADHMGEPGPNEATLNAILTIAARAPDHRMVTPYRFILFQGDARERFGEVLKNAFLANEPDAKPVRIECEQNRFLRAPLVVGVVSSVNKAHKTPEWEQLMTVGAVCQNMLLAASAHGFAAQWITEWYSYDEIVRNALGLADHERMAGFVYIGTAKQEPKERARPDVLAITSKY